MIQRRQPSTTSDRRHPTRRRHLWTHPRKPWLSVPRTTAAAIAVIQTGVHDYAAIASAVGLTVDEVAQIDAAQDDPIRELGVGGIPCGEFFELTSKIRCPHCGVWITTAPCVACQVHVNQYDN